MDLAVYAESSSSSTRLMDGRTDGQTELRWLRRATAVAAVAHKNGTHTGAMCKISISTVLFVLGIAICIFFYFFNNSTPNSAHH